jgi:hypothetical protein
MAGAMDDFSKVSGLEGGSAQMPCVARVAKGMDELTKVLPDLPVGRAAGEKRVGHMIRLNLPEGDNRCTPYPETCRT